jgi:hypothetical protein
MSTNSVVLFLILFSFSVARGAPGTHGKPTVAKKKPTTGR